MASTKTVVLMAVITSGLLSVPTLLSQNILAQAEFLSYENKFLDLVFNILPTGRRKKKALQNLLT
jgi:hypothetical protein